MISVEAVADGYGLTTGDYVVVETVESLVPWLYEDAIWIDDGGTDSIGDVAPATHFTWDAWQGDAWQGDAWSFGDSGDPDSSVTTEWMPFDEYAFETVLTTDDSLLNDLLWDDLWFDSVATGFESDLANFYLADDWTVPEELSVFEIGAFDESLLEYDFVYLDEFDDWNNDAFWDFTDPVADRTESAAVTGDLQMSNLVFEVQEIIFEHDDVVVTELVLLDVFEVEPLPGALELAETSEFETELFAFETESFEFEIVEFDDFVFVADDSIFATESLAVAEIEQPIESELSDTVSDIPVITFSVSLEEAGVSEDALLEFGPVQSTGEIAPTSATRRDTPSTLVLSDAAIGKPPAVRYWTDESATRRPGVGSATLLEPGHVVLTEGNSLTSATQTIDAPVQTAWLTVRQRFVSELDPNSQSANRRSADRREAGTAREADPGVANQPGRNQTNVNEPVVTATTSPGLTATYDDALWSDDALTMRLDNLDGSSLAESETADATAGLTYAQVASGFGTAVILGAASVRFTERRGWSLLARLLRHIGQMLVPAH